MPVAGAAIVDGATDGSREWHACVVRHSGDGGRGISGDGAKEVVDLVLAGEALGSLGGVGCAAHVVYDDDLDVVTEDPAFGVDPFDAELEALE